MLNLSASMGRKMQLLKQELVHDKILLKERQGDSQATKQKWSLSETFNKVDNKMLMQELLAKVAGTTTTFGTADKWILKHKVAACFSVKSTYNQLQNLSMLENWSEGLVLTFKKHWKCPMPWEYIIHGWCVSQNRIVKKDGIFEGKIVNA